MMALKDHSLDDKIIQAAKHEFLEHGFQKASLHKIAERAGTTTGALYTRYKNKDDLFCSLISNAFRQASAQFEPMRQAYVQAQAAGTVEALLAAIHHEEQIYLDLLFAYYEECVLFFCRSEGSSVDRTLQTLMASKAAQTVAYLKSLSHSDGLDLDGVEFIMSQQFLYYRQILLKGYSKEKALSCMKTVEVFLEAGWKALFEQIL